MTRVSFLPAAAGLLLATSPLSAQSLKLADDALRADIFASDPLIQTPIGMTFDKSGQLIVIESQTHFRPKDWSGPPHDQIVRLRDTDGDGRADKREVIFDQTDMTMDIATAPDGSLYLSTRNEILRLADKDGDGSYRDVQRRIVWLESDGKYPHNGLSGIAFDGKGGFYFGMGENLGAAYTLAGSDGTSFADQGEGGNIWHATLEGKRLHRVATGFWNPFGVCVDPWGHVFATDNDPDSSPPCRLHYIVEGGDYGYQFRYGRSGLHPFISWNGELPGTQPMIAGVGEAPCDVIFYAPQPSPVFAGLSDAWHGRLLVASWVDHRIEGYALQPKDGGFTTKFTVLASGGEDFRPVAFATAPDGSLYVSDWVQRDYALHGRGRVWRLSAKQTRALDASPVKPFAADPAAELADRIRFGPAPTDAEVAAWLDDKRPWIVPAVLHRLAREGGQLRMFTGRITGDAHTDAMLLLAARRALEFEGAVTTPLANQLISRSLTQPDSKLRLLGLKWISDARLSEYRFLIEVLLRDPKIDAAVYYGALTALARIESPDTSEAALVKRLQEDVTGKEVPFARRKLALQVLPDRDRNVAIADIEPLLAEAKGDDLVWLVNYLGALHDEKRFAIIRRLAFDKNQPLAVRGAALANLRVEGDALQRLVDIVCDTEADDDLRTAAAQAASGEMLSADQIGALGKLGNVALMSVVARLQGRPFTPTMRPDFGNANVWRNYLERIPGDTSVANGRRVFMSMKLGGCVLCHRAEGIGGTAGPNLDAIGRASEPNYLIESILKPSKNVAPQYEAINLTTKDGQSRIAFRLMERGSTHSYVDLSGHTFEVKIDDILSRDPMPVSIMPEGLVTKLTDAEVRDLVAYLQSLSKQGGGP